MIARALDAGYQPLSLLMERKQITGPAQDILTRCGDAPVNGRNRRYYQITPAGRQQLAAYAQEWSRYRSSIDTFFREVE